MGQVGAVFALEVSRLARSNLDWHRLLELCALTATLVIDEDGCYDPSDFNDGLLLGLKGTMAQAELHFLHARLQGGKLNKAKKGELRFPVPVGYCYDEQGRIVPDADAEVRGAVQMVFRLFRETGSAYAVVHRFTERGLRFPKRAYGGAWDGKIIWGRLSHSRVLGVLKNPSSAGMYVFGRYQYRREINLDGEVRKRMLRLLIKEITVEKPANEKQLLVHIRWQGGACSDLRVALPLNMADRVRYPSTVMDKVRELARHLRDSEIADQLNREGRASAKGLPYTAKIIQWVRWQHRIPPADLKRPEELTVREVAERFGTSDQVVYYWIEHGVIRSRRLHPGMPHWITLSDTDEQKLREWVRNSRRIQRVS
jgi:DNA invertase Pin-like site-specific DNA recombinase